MQQLKCKYQLMILHFQEMSHSRFKSLQFDIYMSRIWTSAQDQKLKQGIVKYGYKWESIKTFMNHTRSINSLVKRWHYKVKYYQNSPVVPKTTVKEESVIESIKEESQVQQEKQKEPKVAQKQIEYIWKKNWSERDDKKLKLLVIESGCMCWKILAESLDTNIEQARMRWKIHVYPTITKEGFKVGGSLKWSLAEDKILNYGFKQQVSWEDEGRFFLPIRTLGSIQARWRRVYKNFQVKENFQNRHLQIRQCLRKIARKQREQQQK